jgi:Rod binding domain-containing protein
MMTTIASGPIDARNASHEAAEQLESLLTQKMLESSGAFKGSGEAGSSLASGLFTEVLADAVSKSGGIGLTAQIEASLPHPTVKDLAHELIAHPPPADEMGGQQ